MSIEFTVTIRWSEERVTELWRAVMGGAFEYCPWWREVQYAEGADWDTPGKVTLWIADPDDNGGDGKKERQKTIGPKDVVRAMYTCMEKGYTDACTGIPIHENMDWDQCSSDAVLQVAVLGGVVYG